MSVLPVSIQGKISEMKGNFTSKGFYISMDQQLLVVDRIRESNQEMENYDKLMDYDVVFLRPTSEDEFQGEGVPVPEEDVYVEKGDDIVSIGYDSDEEEVMVSEGTILDVDDSSFEPVLFTVQTDAAFKPKIYSVFSLDKVNSCLNLVGIFSSKLGKVVHIQFFDEGTRGKAISVFHNGFRGDEKGRRGDGPRSIVISQSKLPGKLIYSLQFEHQSQWLQPHHDARYNKDRPPLYQTALNQFVELYQLNGEIPQEFSFDCYHSSSYKATLQE